MFKSEIYTSHMTMSWATNNKLIQSSAINSGSPGVMLMKQTDPGATAQTPISLRVNSSAIGTVDAMRGAAAIYVNTDYGFRIGVSYVGGSTQLRSYRGKLGEIIVFNRELTASETNDVEAYLTKKWSI